MATLLEQNKLLMESNKEMKDIITKQETEREIAKFETLKTSKLDELSKIHPALAAKHKDTKDLGTLQTAIDAATVMKSDFPEFNSGDTPATEEKKRHKAPKQYKA